jgi:hypothetical protein
MVLSGYGIHYKMPKILFFRRSLPVIVPNVRVFQRRGVRLVPGELLDIDQRHSRGNQAQAKRVTQIAITKHGPQIR